MLKLKKKFFFLCLLLLPGFNKLEFSLIFYIKNFNLNDNTK